MAKGIKIKMNREGERALMRNASLVSGRAEAIAAACNEESSWGGYASAVTVTAIRARATVWSYGRNDDEARTNRLVKNLGAE